MYQEFLNDIYKIKIIEPDGTFIYSVGQRMERAGLKIVRISWLTNLLNQYGILRYQIFAENERGEVFAWLTVDAGNNITVECTQNK
jgi:hypothetical protein